MAKTKVDNKLNVVIGTKAQVEEDNTIPDNSIVIVTDAELIESDIPLLPQSKINGLVTDLGNKVDKTTTVNGKALSSNVTLAVEDIEGVQDLLEEGVPYITTAPTSANTNGNLIMVVLTSEPATKYAGYFYIITEE